MTEARAARPAHRARPRRRAALAAAAAVIALATASTAAEAATSFPNDPFFAGGDQWALHGAVASINAPEAWCVSTGAAITVADVDTGADFSHPDLAGKLIAGAQFLGGTAPYPGAPTAGPGDPSAVSDTVGHGTMTAGIIGADTNNGAGIAAAAPGATVLVVKVLDQTGHDSDVANGIRWAADHGAQVISVSVNDTGSLPVGAVSDIPSAVEYAAGKGVAVALAAGNSGLLAQDPSLQSVALIVGALNPDGTLASYSYSGTVDAPGGTGTTSTDTATRLSQNIVSTGLNGTYITGAGTSFATPEVAGTLALLMARGMSASQARSRILAAVDTRNGLPELDAAQAVGAAGTCGAPTPVPLRVTAPPVLIVPRPAATATPKPTPSPTPTPTATPSPAPTPTPSPSAVPTPQPARQAALPARPVTAGGGGGAALLLLGGGAVVVTVAGAVAWRRRRRRRRPPGAATG